MAHHHSEVLISQSEAGPATTPVELVCEGDLDERLAAGGEALKALAETFQFTAKAGQSLTLSGPDGRAQRIFYGLGKSRVVTSISLRGLPSKLAPGDYSLVQSDIEADEGPLGFALGSYRFDRYKKPTAKSPPRLVVEDASILMRARRTAAACALIRDMINTPARDMGPLQIETIARALAGVHGADVSAIEGEALLTQNYPAVHAVGEAAGRGRAPRIIEITWRSGAATETSPLIAVIGKGVTFDTGGLDMKPSSGMRLMKKDMGGAAHALGLARMVMEADLPVRMTVLIPAVENAISGDAMRPGDVLSSRAGLTIEVGNTDAEGRLVLADALARASELEPTLTVDFATLTGAARAALGPEVTPFYTEDDSLAAAFTQNGSALADPVWRMPLWDGYETSLDSDVADLKNDPDAWAQAGSVTAALFLRRFAPKSGAWVHLDLFAWNPRSRPGWPQGAEAQTVRSIYAVLEARYR